MLNELKQRVYEANMLLPKYGLVTFTWGNVSGIDREKGLMVIKPSGVEYDKLRPEDMVVVDLAGNRVDGELNPSSDTKTHIELYKAFSNIGILILLMQLALRRQVRTYLAWEPPSATISMEIYLVLGTLPRRR